MPHTDDIQDLLNIHTKRLHELKKKQAAYGLAADPSLTLEIETIEAEIQKLRAQVVDDCVDQHPLSAIPGAAGKTVLVVEDSSAWQDILREYLADMACQVVVAVDFSDAHTKLRSHQFDLITIDAHLGPDSKARDGILLLDYVRKKLGPEFPIIIVSGEINKQDLVRAFQKFAVTGVLLKEYFECDEFQAIVAQALA